MNLETLKPKGKKISVLTRICIGRRWPPKLLRWERNNNESVRAIVIWVENNMLAERQFAHTKSTTWSAKKEQRRRLEKLLLAVMSWKCCGVCVVRQFMSELVIIQSVCLWNAEPDSKHERKHQTKQNHYCFGRLCVRYLLHWLTDEMNAAFYLCRMRW